MRLFKIILMTSAVSMAQVCMAEGPPFNSQGPFGDIQVQLDDFAARVQALEDAAPMQSVEGRDYCFVLNLQIMRGRAPDASEELQNNVIRRKVNFANGTVAGALISNVLNNQLDDGTVLAGTAATVPNLLATYVQTGSKINVTFDSGDTANWYVSKDGSLIHGAMIRHQEFGPPNGLPPIVTVGSHRNWTMVETDPNDVCDAEQQ
jgi:hypothetical protein